MSADQYHMTILRVRVESSSRLLFSKLTADQALGFYWIVGSSQVITLGESEGEHGKAIFWQNVNSDASLLTFLLTYSLHNRILESP